MIVFPDRKVPSVAGSVGPYGAFLHDGSEYTGVYASSMSVEVWWNMTLLAQFIIAKYHITCKTSTVLGLRS